MSPASLLALLGMVEAIVQATPQALSLFNSVKSMIVSDAEPTPEQWASLNAMLAVDHVAVQAG